MKLVVAAELVRVRGMHAQKSRDFCCDDDTKLGRTERFQFAM